MNLKKLLLMTTILTSNFVLGQKEEKQTLDKKNKFKTELGLANIRSMDGSDNFIQRSFIKPTYYLTDKFSVSAEMGASYFPLLDKNVYNFSPAIHFEHKKIQASFGFFDVNNQLFIKTTYKDSDKNLSFSAHAQNLTKAPAKTNFFPEIPDQLNVSFLALAETKSLMYKKNKFKIGAVAGLGLSSSPNENIRLAYKAMFAASYGDMTFVAGLQPLAPVAFDQKATFLLKYNL